MITRFGSLFAGNVDLDDIGFEGTPVNDRWLPDQHLTTAFDKCLSFTQLMDELGYDTFWSAEHHFQREGYEWHPQPADGLRPPRPPDQKHKIRLRV